MNARILSVLLGLAGLLAAGSAAQAQPAALPGAPVAPTDVLLLASGTELTGRVLAITPTELTYLPATPAPDTLRVPTATVFLVRYANGTREVMADLTTPAPTAPPDLGPPALRGLSAPERRAAGQRDARLRFPGAGPFWGCLASSACLGPAIGLAPTAGFAFSQPRLERLAGPQRPLLADPDYRQGFKRQAVHTQRSRSWTGYGIGCGVFVALVAGFFGTNL